MNYKISKLKHKSLAAAMVVLLTVGVSTITKAAVLYQDQTENDSFNLYKGKIIDADSHKELVFATLSIDSTNISTVTNTEGEFSLKVPSNIKKGSVTISFLGYTSKSISLSDLKDVHHKIALETSVTALSEVNVTVPKNAETLVNETFKKKGDNYFVEPTLMTAFYRETIKKRRKNVSLSEAVVNIYKAPYSSNQKDAVELYKARKSTDYDKLDTLVLKLQGGPYNALFVDIMKYPEYIFTEETIPMYTYTFERSARINDQLIYVVNFKQKENQVEQLYKGQLFIDAENKILTSAIYALDITNKEDASRMFVKKKPAKANVYPTEIAYRVDYREKDNKWYYGYSNVLLEFKINWDDRLFNSVYSMTCEMAVTDWEKNLSGTTAKGKEKLRRNIILSDEAIGFSDPNFWGEYNIIEPEKSIESAIKKIQKQLRKDKIGEPVALLELKP